VKKKIGCTSQIDFWHRVDNIGDNTRGFFEGPIQTLVAPFANVWQLDAAVLGVLIKLPE
jgi:hypothetical protein